MEYLRDIFDTMWYTSRKAFIKGLTRGALGNALKTLLGIPYALRNRVAGDWNPTLKPLSIRCKDKEYQPRYIVDSLAQKVQVEYKVTKCKPIEGTLISLNLDHFEQERPRTLQGIALLAQRYHLCNPHAQFSWTAVIDGEELFKCYEPDPSWMSKFRGVAPIHWYSLIAFQDVLGALYRKQRAATQHEQISLKSLYQCFAAPDSATVRKIVQAFGQDGITATEIEGSAATQLYRILLQHSPCLTAAQLGSIGAPHVRAVLADTFSVDGDVLYTSQANDDPEVPFVIEAAAAYLKEGKRALWTAINFSPTYADPFQSRYLRTPLQPDEPVLGLRGFLEAYGFLEDSPVMLFLHVICPNVEHHEFSKTEINHLPFKQVLGEVLGKLLTDLRQTQEDEELQLEETIYQTLDAILNEMDKHERFILGQLLEKVRARLHMNPAYATWLTRPDSQNRLQTYLAKYLSSNTVLAQSLAHSSTGIITIPLHPNRHFTLSTEHISQEVFVRRHVNKVLYIEERELESVAIENKWLCRMDMALVHNPQSVNGLRDVLLQCAMKSHLPILIWHNADDTGQALVQQLHAWFQDFQLDTSRIVDLGLAPTKGQPTRLIAMMPGEQAVWLSQRFEELHIPLKALPLDQDIRHDISKRLENLLFGRLIEHLKLNTLPFFEGS